MEKRSVEDSFRTAFQEAKMSPSETVWTHIELGIEKEAAAHLGRKVVFYRWVAAASVGLLLSFLGIGYLTNSNDASSPVAKSHTVDLPKVNVDQETLAIDYQRDNQQNQNSDKKKNTVANAPTSTQSFKRAQDTDEINNQSKALLVSLVKQDNTLVVPNETTAAEQKNRIPSPLPPLYRQRPIVPHFPKTEPDQIDLLLASIELQEKEQKRKKNEMKEGLWTSLSVAAGSFNPVNTSSQISASMNAPGGPLTSNQSSSLTNQVDASGYSFSSGVSVGGRISNRWVLMGGINYLAQNSDYSSDAVVLDGQNNYRIASFNTLSSESFDGTIVASSPYMITSTMQFFNIPLQAGYRIVNKAFGWQVQGGISSDFFLQNSLSASDAGLGTITQGSGDESPYRTINFSGLLGTEISYRVGTHYRFAINPGVRYPLNSVYKSDVGINAAPLTFDVGLKFFYIFK